jgi:hypothetical protein
MKLAVSPTYEKLVSEVLEVVEVGDMPALEKIVLDHRCSGFASHLARDERLTPLVAGMRAAYCVYETNEELRLRDRLVMEAAPLIKGSVPVERTFRYVPAEARAAGISDASRYCHVGSGPLPETILAMRNVAPFASLTGVDADRNMLVLGKEFANAAWPGNAISFLHAQGNEIDYRGFTHVHLAVLVRPERQTVECICETADEDVTIMLRNVDGLGGWLYEPAAGETQEVLLDYGFRRVELVRGHTIMHTEIYRR